MNHAIVEKIKSLSQKYFEETVNIRRHIHQNPELSFQEIETANFVEKKCLELELENVRRMAKTGVIAELDNGADKWIALRADIDALPIEEENDIPFKSKNLGVMHACGHDAHTASLLGAAMILKEIRKELPVNIRFIFQPAEEKLPGGASQLIKEGVLENPRIENVLGQHVMPLLDVGQIGLREGLYMASADEIYLTFNGKGGHAAHPYTLKDPVLACSNTIVSLQQLVSRIAHPKIPTVLSFGKIMANGATNIIPNKVYVEGTLRTYDEEWRAQAHASIKEIAHYTSKAHGCSVDVDIRKGYPFLKNDEQLIKKIRPLAEALVGKENVINLDLWPAGEDFAFYSQERPSAFWRFGTRTKNDENQAMLHTSLFNVDEESLKYGMAMLTLSTFA